ncbi:LysR family transcriptional regulator [Aquisalimonas asiatica]|nr:LysR family transcriptional regulator [Aquisalimonas asiatica]
MGLNIKQLRYFVAIARLGSLSKAGEHLDVAQPALSQSLRSLEEEVGFPLLDRHSRGVTLTYVGSLLLDHFTEILSQVDKTPSLVSDFTNNPSGKVMVGVTTTAASSLVAPLLTSASENLPRITIHVVEAMSGRLREELENQTLDIVTLYDISTLEPENHVITSALNENLFLVSSPDKIPEETKTVSFRDLSNYPLVLPSMKHTLGAHLDQVARKQRSPLKIQYETDSFAGIIELMRNGFASILPFASVSSLVESGHLRAVPIHSPPIRWSLYVAALRSSMRNMCVRAIYNLLVAQIEEQYRNNRQPSAVNADAQSTGKR